MRPLPSSAAFWAAVLYTFSNTRGTETTTVGLNAANIGTRFLMSLVNPTVTLLATHANVMARASTWASGRKVSSRPPGRSSVGSTALAPRTS